MLTIPSTQKERSALLLTSAELRNPVSESQIGEEWVNKAALLTDL